MSFLALLIPGVGMGAGTAPNLVEVPDVVGETEAAGTATLEGAGFVVSASEAYSSTVAAGLIISQSPEGGEFANEGSTVAIVVSLGPQPVDDTATGGWAFRNYYEAELQRRKARERLRKKLEEETEQIQDELDRAIAQELRKQEAIDDKREDYKRLADLAKANADLEAARQYSERVHTAFARVLAKGNYSAIEALDRELKRAKEEEAFLMEAFWLLVD